MPRLLRLFGVSVPDREIGRRLRTGMERLGITYIKLGQYLAMRLDIMPEEIAAELGALFEQVEPLPVSVIRATITASLGRPASECFPTFATEPLGSASIAQVHRAITSDGEVVAVKVKRPNIDRLFAADARNLRRLARIADALDLLGVSVAEVIEQFVAFTSRELDLAEECRTADIIRLSNPPHIHIPQVRWDLSTASVLTMELVEGQSFDKICRLSEAGRLDEVYALLPGVDLQQAFRNVIRASLYMTFEAGRFHGDPHPGNMILRSDGRVALVDFGIYGELRADQQETFREYLEAVSLGRGEEAARVHDRMCIPTRRTDLRRFHAELAITLRRWHASASAQLPRAKARAAIGQVYGELLATMRRNAVQALPEQILLWRSLALLDLTAARWPAPVNVAGEMTHFFEMRHRRATERALKWQDWLAALPSPDISRVIERDHKLPLIARVRRERAIADEIQIALATTSAAATVAALAFSSVRWASVPLLGVAFVALYATLAKSSSRDIGNVRR